MEQKPHKKEELMVANSVLKLAEDLLKVTFNHDNDSPLISIKLGFQLISGSWVKPFYGPYWRTDGVRHCHIYDSERSAFCHCHHQQFDFCFM